MSTIHPSVRVVGLRIRNYRGIGLLNIPVQPGGAVFAGRNRAGKTSAIRALRAALEGIGVDPGAIRQGEEKSEIIVDLGVATLSRKITARSTTQEVRDADGTILPKPAQQLRELIGPASLDPLDFYLAPPAKRRQLLMAACPVTVTADDLDRWCETKKDWNVIGHGQEVLERVRATYYSQRTEANRAKEEAEARLRVAEEQLRELGEPSTALSVEAAQTRVAAEERNLAVLRERRRQADEAVERAGQYRAQVEHLRSGAQQAMVSEAVVAKPKNLALHAANLQASEKKREELQDLEFRVSQLRKELLELTEEGCRIEGELEIAEKQEKESARLASEADQLEEALNRSLPDHGDLEAQLGGAEGALDAARLEVAAAARSEKARAAKQTTAEHRRMRDEAKDRAEHLDRIVDRLTKEAPAELSKRSNMIPGVVLTESSTTIDGVDLEVRSGAEQMALAIEVAKRTAGHARILIIDGLERIDPEQQPEFLKQATSGGWQVFGTLVASGDLAVIDIEGDQNQAGSSQ